MAASWAATCEQVKAFVEDRVYPARTCWGQCAKAAYLRIDADGTGEMAFGALVASVDGRLTSSGVDFDWGGADERDQVTGTGWADLRDDGFLEGEIAYDIGDETSFIAKPWPFSAAC